MSGFLERLLARSAGEEPAVRPRIDPWGPVDVPSAEVGWGEVIEEVAAPRTTRRMTRPNAVADEDPVTPDGDPEAPVTTRRASKPHPAQIMDAVEPINRDRTGTPLFVAPEPVETSAPAVASAPAHDQATPAVASTSTTGPDTSSSPPKQVMATRPVRVIAPARVATAQTRQRTRLVAARGGRPVPQLVAGRTAETFVPDVVISIGRIEVRAPVTTPPARRAAAAPDTSRLDQYLETRTGRSPR